MRTQPSALTKLSAGPRNPRAKCTRLSAVSDSIQGRLSFISGSSERPRKHHENAQITRKPGRLTPRGPVSRVYSLAFNSNPVPRLIPVRGYRSKVICAARALGRPDLHHSVLNLISWHITPPVELSSYPHTDPCGTWNSGRTQGRLKTDRISTCYSRELGLGRII